MTLRSAITGVALYVLRCNFLYIGSCQYHRSAQKLRGTALGFWVACDKDAHEFDFQWSQIGSADQTPVYLHMPSVLTGQAKSFKKVCVRWRVYEKMWVTVILCTMYGCKLPLYMEFTWKALPETEKLSKNVINRPNLGKVPTFLQRKIRHHLTDICYLSLTWSWSIALALQMGGLLIN